MWKYVYPDELYHYGRLGMKWGQNIFAKRRERKLNKVRRKNLEKARDAKAKKQKEAEKRKEDLEKGRISPKKMTDQELQEQINRMNNEKRYKELVLETRPVKRLMSKAWSDAIVPGVTEAGKELLKKTLNKYGSEMLGLNEKKVKSEYDKIKEMADMAKWQKQAFEDKRDLAEAKKNYNAYLSNTEAQEKARQRYVDSLTGEDKKSKKNKNGGNNNNDNGNKNNSADNNSNNNNANQEGNTKNVKNESTPNNASNSSNKTNEGQKYTESSKAASTKYNAAETSPTIKQAEAWLEDPSTGEKLRKTLVGIEED